VDTSKSFLARHEFFLRRLHSLAGLIPVGAYMVIHLLTNASIWDGVGSFQAAVHQIHSLGKALPFVEWTFIFIPILFHGIYGLIITRDGQFNQGSYPYIGNLRYTMQRATGLIAFLFIGYHVFHMHGWIHTKAWREFITPWGGQFSPFNAATTGSAAIQQTTLVMVVYLIGVLACVFHLANGIWTMGITWGIWTTAEAQRRANYIAGAVGAIVLMLGLAAWSGFAFKIDTKNPAKVEEARVIENQMLKSRMDAGLIDEDTATEKSAPSPPDVTAMATQHESDSRE